MRRITEEKKSKSKKGSKDDRAEAKPAPPQADEEPATGPPAEATRRLTPPRRHDFSRGRLLSKSQVAHLEVVHRKLARSVSEALSILVRHRVEATFLGMGQRTYGEFINGLHNPTGLHLVNCRPKRRSFVLEMSPAILFPCVERLLGGSGDDPFRTVRPFTRVEQSLVGLIAQRIIEVARESWALSPEDLHFDLAEFEHNPLMVQAVGPEEPTAVLGYQLSFGRNAGRMHFGLPIQPFEDILGRLRGAAKTEGTQKNSARERERILSALAENGVSVSADLVSLPLELSDVVALKPGDVIETQLPRDAEVSVKINDEHTFQAKPVERGGRRAVRLLGDEPPPPAP